MAEEDIGKPLVSASSDGRLVFAAPICSFRFIANQLTADARGPADLDLKQTSFRCIRSPEMNRLLMHRNAQTIPRITRHWRADTRKWTPAGYRWRREVYLQYGLLT